MVYSTGSCRMRANAPMGTRSGAAPAENRAIATRGAATTVKLVADNHHQLWQMYKRPLHWTCWLALVRMLTSVASWGLWQRWGGPRSMKVCNCGSGSRKRTVLFSGAVHTQASNYPTDPHAYLASAGLRAGTKRHGPWNRRRLRERRPQ